MPSYIDSFWFFFGLKFKKNPASISELYRSKIENFLVLRFPRNPGIYRWLRILISDFWKKSHRIGIFCGFRNPTKKSPLSKTSWYHFFMSFKALPGGFSSTCRYLFRLPVLEAQLRGQGRCASESASRSRAGQDAPPTAHAYGNTPGTPLERPNAPVPGTPLLRKPRFPGPPRLTRVNRNYLSKWRNLWWASASSR